MILSILKKLFWFLPIWYKPKYGAGVYSEPVREERRDGWVYSYDKNGRHIGTCLEKFDIDDNPNEEHMNGVILLSK